MAFIDQSKQTTVANTEQNTAKETTPSKPAVELAVFNRGGSGNLNNTYK